MTRSSWERWAVGVGVAALCGAGLLAELGAYLWAWPANATEFFSLSYEHNLPTWASSALLLLVSLALGDTARSARQQRGAWWALCILFALMSLDEALELHEHLGTLVRGRGVLYFSWVIPAGIVVALIGLAFVPFLARLEPLHRRRFVAAGVLYVGGALLMELPLGWWAERAGDDNLVYGLLDWLEESLELCGAGLFLLAVRERERAREP